MLKSWITKSNFVPIPWCFSPGLSPCIQGTSMPKSWTTKSKSIIAPLGAPIVMVGGGAGAGSLGFREACLYFSGSLDGARRLFSKTFGRRPLQTFEAVPAPGATMLRWPASARQEPAQTPLTLDAQSPGTGVSRFFKRRRIQRRRFKKRDAPKKYRKQNFVAPAAKRLKLLRHRRLVLLRRRPIADPEPYSNRI